MLLFGIGIDDQLSESEREELKLRNIEKEKLRKEKEIQQKEKAVEFKKVKDYLDSNEGQEYLGCFMKKFLYSEKGEDIINSIISSREREIKEYDRNIKRQREKEIQEEKNLNNAYASMHYTEM